MTLWNMFLFFLKLYQKKFEMDMVATNIFYKFGKIKIKFTNKDYLVSFIFLTALGPIRCWAVNYEYLMYTLEEGSEDS